jgi:hypothetical protein
MKRVLIFLVAALAVAGCSVNMSSCAFSRNAQLRRTAIKALSQSDRASLVADANALWQQHADSDALDVPESDWPDSFRPFKPVRVFRYSQGIYIIMDKFVSHTAGVYIIVKPNFTPEGKSNSSYERLEEGIFWTLTS